jgi:hypothetical protein
MNQLEETVHDIDIASAIADRITDTVLAIGGSLHVFAVLLPANVNQSVDQILGIDELGERPRKKQNLKIYTTMLYLLFRSCPADLSGVVVIDQDIDADSLARAKRGAKALIKREAHPRLKFRIESGRVGKRSRAHEITNDVYNGRRAADIVLTIEGCLEIMERLKM